MEKTCGFVRANDGVRLYYEEAGTGKPIVLIHGGGLSMDWWRRNFAPLAAEFHVVAADTRGCGRSDECDWGHRTARYAMDVREIVHTLGLHDVTLVGWSIGARTVWSYLELFGDERLRGVVLVDETVQWDVHTPPDEGENPPRQPDESHDDYRRRQMRMMFGRDHRDLSEEELAWMVASGGKPDQPGRHTLGGDYKGQDWRPLCPHIKVPTLITTGEESGARIGMEYAAEHTPGARLEVFPGCGHGLFYEDADRFNRTVADFVRGEDRTDT